MGEMRISDSDSNSVNQIPPAPRADSSMAPPAAQSSPSPTTPSPPAPAPFKAYVPQPSAPPVQPVVASSSNMNHYYAQSPPPTFTRPPVANNDPRVQDTVELCNFAILALKVFANNLFFSFLCHMLYLSFHLFIYLFLMFIDLFH